jgi:tetratricopeptide (TPR) repeat protein
LFVGWICFISLIYLLLFILYFYCKKKKKKNQIKTNNKIAVKLKDLGNQAFKQGDIEKAIDYYGKSLDISKKDAHLVYSNRSAAWLKLDANKALDDARMCIKVAPDWAKVRKHLKHKKKNEKKRNEMIFIILFIVCF